VTNRFHEIGTPQSLAETDAYLKGIPANQVRGR
jgi:hypothetical protein